MTSINGLIGYTGFVGSNLDTQFDFDKKYNSSNIEEIKNQEFNILVCAGVSGTKWLANKNPSEDFIKINKLLDNIKSIKCNKFILISTVDVYRDTYNVDENTLTDFKNLHSYGKNRVLVEVFVKEHFCDYQIIRLPAIYGDNIKKNFVYDLLNNHCLHWTHKDSKFQYYHLKNLWNDIETVINNNISVINFNSEPISAKELAKEAFDMDFDNITDREPHNYNIRSIYTNLFNEGSNYMYDREEIFSEMREFIKKYRR